MPNTWNLVGLPLTPLVKLEYRRLFAFDPLGAPPYLWDGTGYVETDTLEVGRGYWVSPEVAGSVQLISGFPDSVLTLELVHGWNMIAPPNCTPTDLHRFQIIDPNGIPAFSNAIFGYDENGYYSVNDSLKAGHGYWFETDTAGTYTMDCSLVTSSKTAYAPPGIPDSFGRLTVQDAAGGNQDLYFGGTLPADFQGSFRMPPRPFEGTFDVRLVGDTRLTEEEAATVRIQAREYPVTIALTQRPASGSTYLLEEFIGDQLVASRTLAPGTPL